MVQCVCAFKLVLTECVRSVRRVGAEWAPAGAKGRNSNASACRSSLHSPENIFHSFYSFNNPPSFGTSLKIYHQNGLKFWTLR